MFAATLLAWSADGLAKPQILVFDEPLSKLRTDSTTNGLVVSRDGRRVAQVLATGGRWTVLVNDKQMGGGYEGIGRDSVHFSPDGQRVAFVGVRSGQKVLVVDGEESPEHEGIARSATVFSPDSTRTAYVALRENRAKMAVFVDGVEAAEYDGIGRDGLIFSPDSKRLGFVGKKGPRFVAVLDGKEGSVYDGAAALVFSPDSAHFAYIATQAGQMCLVVDDHEVSRFDGIPQGTVPVFDSPGKLHVVALQGTNVVRVEVLVPGVIDDSPADEKTRPEEK